MNHEHKEHHANKKHSNNVETDNSILNNQDQKSDTIDKEIETSPNPIDEMKKTLETIVEKLAITEDKYLRLNAEFENYKKRAQKDRIDARISAQFEVLNSIVPIIDHFELAMASANQTNNLEKLYEGLKLIKSEFEKALSNNNVETINALGEEFDPRYHEAIGYENSEEYKKDIISKQWRSGYKIGDRLLRPATVVISKGKE